MLLGGEWQPRRTSEEETDYELYEELFGRCATVAAIRAAILRNIKVSKNAIVPLLREMADRVEGKVTQPIAEDVPTLSELSDEELQTQIERLTEALRATEQAVRQSLIPAVGRKERRQQALMPEQAGAILMRNRDGSTTIMHLQFV